MGNLFSNQEEEERLRRERVQKEHQRQQQLKLWSLLQQQRAEEIRRETEERLIELEKRNRIRRENEERLKAEQEARDRENERKILNRKKNEQLLLQFNKSDLFVSFCSKILRNDRDFEFFNKIVLLSVNDNMVRMKFKNTTQKHFKITDLQKNCNPFLKSSYLLRKKEYEIIHGKHNVQEELVFHGTRCENLTAIQMNNFDWRRHGNARGNIFGKGVSFTPISNYASNYCGKNNESRCMYGVRVLKGSSCLGNRDMTFPPLLDDGTCIHHDTSEKPDGHVIVKYRDDEFYPEYLIHFNGFAIKKPQGKSNAVYHSNSFVDFSSYY